MTAAEIPGIFVLDQTWQRTGVYPRDPLGLNIGQELPGLPSIIDNTPGVTPTKGFFKAFNPLTGKSDWVIESPHFWNGGALATAGGLVFQGKCGGSGQRAACRYGRGAVEFRGLHLLRCAAGQLPD